MPNFNLRNQKYSKIPKRVVAYHEAGHAVAHIRSRIKFTYIAIKSRNGIYEGVIKFDPCRTISSIEAFLSPHFFQVNFPRDFIGYAGLTAELIINPESNGNHGGDSDLQRIKSCYKDFPNDLKEKYFQFLESYTKNAIIQDWDMVRVIAEALMEKETLSLEDVIIVAKSATLDKNK